MLWTQRANSRSDTQTKRSSGMRQVFPAMIVGLDKVEWLLDELARVRTTVEMMVAVVVIVTLTVVVLR